MLKVINCPLRKAYCNNLKGKIKVLYFLLLVFSIITLKGKIKVFVYSLKGKIKVLKTFIFPFDFSIKYLTQRYIQYHHYHKATNKTQYRAVGKFITLRFRNYFFYHYIYHGTGRKCQRKR